MPAFGDARNHSECKNVTVAAVAARQERESRLRLSIRVDGLVSGVLGRKTAPRIGSAVSQRVRAHAHACARAIRRSVRSRKPSIDEEDSQPSRYFLLRLSVNSTNRPSAFLLLGVKIASRAFARFSARDHPPSRKLGASDRPTRANDHSCFISIY